jgi:non-ribosomal peptide synthetase component E (peptide arylation enzyme)
MELPTIEARFSAEEMATYRDQGLWTDEVLADLLDRAADERPDGLCVADGHTQLTFVEARDRAWRLASGLAELGIALGDRVAVQLPNWVDAVIAYYAIARIGAVLVPRMLIYREHEVGYAIDRTEAKALIVPDHFRGFDYSAMAMELASVCPSLEHVIVIGDAPDGAVSFESLLAEHPYAGPGAVADDPHVILFTSGTTAQPKGVVHTWNTYFASAVGLARYYECTIDDVCLMPSPIMHNTGLLAGVVTPLLARSATVVQDVWEPSVGLELISRFGCTFSVGATPFVTMMIDAHDPAKYDLSTFRLFACGGAPVPGSVVREAVEVLGCELMTVFGQSESSLQTLTRMGDSVDRVASSDGAAVDGTDIAILDDDGVEVQRGTEGEICSRGPSVMLGYLHEPEHTAEAFAHGWFHSGDLGRMEDDGYIRVTGRKKDIIIRGGVNISPTEIEEFILEHPLVAVVSIVGMPDRKLGEKACAFVVPAGDEVPTLEAITSFLREKKIAAQKLPERLEVRSELPMTATGKVEKYRLREEAAALSD